MILKTYKELWHFCTRRFRYLLLLALFLTPATIIDYHFEKTFVHDADSMTYFMASFMNLVQSIFCFLVVAYLYVHWHEHKGFTLGKFVKTSFQKLYPTVSGYIWFVVFMLLPFAVIWTFSGVIAEFAIVSSKKITGIHDYFVEANGTFNMIIITVMLIGFYLALKVLFIIYFVYKAGDKVGLVALRKSMQIKFAEIVQFIIVMIIYSLIYSVLLYCLGYVLGTGCNMFDINYVNLVSSDSSPLNLLVFFVVTLLNLPFSVLYVAFAYHLYQRYTN